MDPTGTTARVQRLTALVAIVLVAVAVGFAFGRVFIGYGATLRLLAVGFVSAIVAWLLERRNLLLATVVSATLLILAIGIVVFPGTTWFGAPTLETLRHIGHAAAQVGEAARIQISPAPANDSLMLAAIAAVWACVFSCFALAFRSGSPLLALVPPIALVAFADSVLQGVIKPVYGVLFLIAALAVVFADSLRRIHGWGPVWSPPDSRDRLLPSVGWGARRVGAGAVILAAIAPIVVPGFGSKAEIDLSSINADHGRVQVSPLVQIGAILNQGEEVEVFQVRSNDAVYWRMAGLDLFDANGGWSPSPQTGVPVQLRQPLQEVAAGSSTVAIDATVTVKSDLAFTTLPIPYQPHVLVSSDASASWFARSQTMSAVEWPDAGAQYHIRSVYPTPTAEELRVTPFGTESAFPGETQLPSGPEIDEIRQLAEEWTSGKENGFDEVMAIQQHLHAFHYDKTAQYQDSLRGLVEFLKVRQEGFCVHFAYAMGVMLRTLGIPARVATGFTPGQGGDDDGTYSVTTNDLHAWVEVPFERYGWLPFEPTPFGMVNPATTSYIFSSDLASCQGAGCEGSKNGDGGGSRDRPKPSVTAACSDEDPLTICGDSPSVSAGRNPTPTATLPPERSGTRMFRLFVGASGIAGLIVAGVPLGRSLRRRRRLANAARDPRGLILATYGVFSERAADLGLGRGPGETPREYRVRIEATDLLTDGHMERLTGTVVRAAYSARPLTEDDALDATADADQVIRDLRRSSPFGRRILGIYRRD
jgi:transglutaminase-like putative cysteine protease